MFKISALLCGVASLFSLAPCVLAQSSARTYVESGETVRVRRTVTTIRQLLPYETLGYYPTLKYYGKDYTVHYGFVPVSRQTLRRIYESDPILLTPEEAVGNADSVRVVVGARRAVGVPNFRATKVTTVVTQTPVVTTETQTGAVQSAPVTDPPRETAPEALSAPLPPPYGTASPGPVQPALPAPAQTEIQPSNGAK